MAIVQITGGLVITSTRGTDMQNAMPALRRVGFSPFAESIEIVNTNTQNLYGAFPVLESIGGGGYAGGGGISNNNQLTNPVTAFGTLQQALFTISIQLNSALQTLGGSLLALTQIDEGLTIEGNAAL